MTHFLLADSEAVQSLYRRGLFYLAAAGSVTSQDHIMHGNANARFCQCMPSHCLPMSEPSASRTPLAIPARMQEGACSVNNC